MPARKQITKERILQAALSLLKEQGFEAVTIKQLAAELGCSTQPVYLSFTGMDELRNELIPLAMQEFEACMKNSSPDGIIRLYDLSYVEFARQEPRLFRFLFMRAGSFAEIKRSLLPLIERAVTHLMQTYSISHEQADWLHDQLWMHAHGIAAMTATDFCNWDMDKVRRMLEQCRLAFIEKSEARHD